MKSPTGVGTPRIRLVGLALVAIAGALLALQYASRDGPPSKSSGLGAGYERRVRTLLVAGETAAALEELERASLLDAANIALLRRRRAGAAFAREIAIDAQLRTHIAAQLLEALRGADIRDERDLLDRALANGTLLVELKPEAARSHHLLGMTHLLRGDATRAPIEYIKAVSHLQQALEIDPEIKGAQEALHYARAHARR